MEKHGANIFEKAAVDVQSKWDASNHWGNEFHTIANLISKKTKRKEILMVNLAIFAGRALLFLFVHS